MALYKCCTSNSPKWPPARGPLGEDEGAAHDGSHTCLTQHALVDTKAVAAATRPTLCLTKGSVPQSVGRTRPAAQQQMGAAQWK